MLNIINSIYHRVYLVVRYYIMEFPYERRRNNLIKKNKLENYEWIKEYKDKYKGKRCFIVCNGPSLTESDYIKLKNEYTFGMNYITRWFEKTGFETTFYVCQDYFDRARYMDKDFHSIKKSVIFFSDHMFKKYGFTYEGKYNLLPASLKNLHFPQEKRKFPKDILCEGVYLGETVVYACIQLAWHMGFSEIYLIGADCQLNNAKNLHANGLGRESDIYSVKKIDDDNVLNYIISDYSIVKSNENYLPFKLINLTRGGALELFERKNLDDIL